MHIAPQPANERERLATLERFGVLDSLPQQAFDDITALASTICGTPIALISLVDADRQWFKSRVGLDATQTSREVAFCSHAILAPNDVMVVEDATKDSRFHDNPLVKDAPDIRFYAGAPIVTRDGFSLGTVCVIDREARSLAPAQVDALRSLSRLVVSLLEHEKQQRDQAATVARAAYERNDFLMAIATHSLDLKAFVDRDYVYRYVNEKYLDYWQCGREDVEGRTIAAVMGEAVFRQLVRPRMDQALSGEAVAFDAPLDFPGRGTRHVEIDYLPARGVDGEIIGVVVRVHDAQAHKDREEQLRSTVAQLEKKTLEQQRFIHVVSHDLREPVNTIINFCSLLTAGHASSLSDAGQKYLSYVQGGGQRMKALLDDLLELVRLDGQTVRIDWVDLDSIMQQVRHDLTVAFTRAEARLEYAPLGDAMGDPSLIRIVLQNLVSNAIKFRRAGVPPVVQIESAVMGDFCELRVCDNGIGIEPEHLSKVFELFQRLHSRKEYEGTGLGLSICRRIAGLLGGSISASSVPGEGSCFVLRLPHRSEP